MKKASFSKKQRHVGVAAAGILTLMVAVILVFQTVPTRDGQYSARAASTTATELVSADSSGTVGNNLSFMSDISGDGRYIVFESFGSNIATGDTNGTRDVIMLDRVANTRTLVSVATDGTQGNWGTTPAGSGAPKMSADARYVAFISSSSNLVANDTNNIRDYFLRDRTAGTTVRVSVATDGTQQNSVGAAAATPDVNDDGRYVVFRTTATNLVASDTNGVEDVFLRDTQSNTTTRVNVSTAGTQANGATTQTPRINSDGRYIVFSSVATNLIASDTNGASDIFVRDTQSGTTTRVSVSSSGTEGNGASTIPQISADGRYITYTSAATNLVATDTNGATDIFMYDMTTGTTSMVSILSNGTQGNGASTNSIIAPDASVIAFTSAATNFAASDTNGVQDAFVVPLGGGDMTRFSVATDGTQSDANSIANGIADGGGLITFNTLATTLSEADTNGLNDVYLATITEDEMLVSEPPAGFMGWVRRFLGLPVVK